MWKTLMVVHSLSLICLPPVPHLFLYYIFQMNFCYLCYSFLKTVSLFLDIFVIQFSKIISLTKNFSQNNFLVPMRILEDKRDYKEKNTHDVN